LPKVALFLLMMTRVITSGPKIDKLIWVIILAGGLYTGYDGWTAGPGRFVKGRLDELGGTDFRESSAVAAHLAAVAVITGARYLKSRSWLVKTVCVAAGGLAVNAIVMTGTRAAIVGLCVGAAVAPFLAPRKGRLKVCGYLVLGGLAAAALTNQQFWQRTETIVATGEEREASAEARLELWAAGFAMWQDNPQGVGAGSFYTVVGRYDPKYEGRDCHNTYIRCLAELGVPGIGLLAALIVNAFRTLRRASSLAVGTPLEHDVQWDSYGLMVALVVYLTAGIFMGLTYIEELWWFLSIPVCLERAALGARGLAPVGGASGA
jgi:putative inorganic carbon (HCO3(-)) transporter